MRNTAILLADTWAKTQDVLYHAFTLPPAQGIEYIISNYPQVQGMRNQMQLRRLAGLSCMTSEIPTEIAECLAKTAKESS